MLLNDISISTGRKMLNNIIKNERSLINKEEVSYSMREVFYFLLPQMKVYYAVSDELQKVWDNKKKKMLPVECIGEVAQVKNVDIECISPMPFSKNYTEVSLKDLNGKTARYRAHRASLAISNGVHPDVLNLFKPELEVSHLCKRANCCKNSHLTFESSKDNNRRKKCCGYVYDVSTGIIYKVCTCSSLSKCLDLKMVDGEEQKKVIGNLLKSYKDHKEKEHYYYDNDPFKTDETIVSNIYKAFDELDDAKDDNNLEGITEPLNYLMDTLHYVAPASGIMILKSLDNLKESISVAPKYSDPLSNEIKDMLTCSYSKEHTVGSYDTVSYKSKTIRLHRFIKCYHLNIDIGDKRVIDVLNPKFVDGSHRCHKSRCFKNFHVKFELKGTNTKRSSCIGIIVIESRTGQVKIFSLCHCDQDKCLHIGGYHLGEGTDDFSIVSSCDDSDDSDDSLDLEFYE